MIVWQLDLQLSVQSTNSSYLSLDGSTYNEINLSKDMIMALNATFNNISVISWPVRCIGGGHWSPREIHIDLSQVTDKPIGGYNGFCGDQFYWEKTSVPEENYGPAASHCKNSSHKVVWSNLMYIKIRIRYII
jgi:hypothetical protein